MIHVSRCWLAICALLSWAHAAPECIDDEVSLLQVAPGDLRARNGMTKARPLEVMKPQTRQELKATIHPMIQEDSQIQPVVQDKQVASRWHGMLTRAVGESVATSI